jgi:hypothetical protein
LNWRCQNCESEKVDARQFEYNADLVEAAEKKAPSFISIGTFRTFRDRYVLSQRDASKLIGAGGGAFGKYESGKGISGPTAKLIKVALRFPEVAQMLAEEEGIDICSIPAEWSTAGASMAQALTEAGEWLRDTVPSTFQIRSNVKKPSCVNDEEYLINLGMANSHWEITRVAVSA